MDNEEFDSYEEGNSKGDNILTKNVKERFKKETSKMLLLLLKSPFFWALIGIFVIIIFVFLIQISLTIMKLNLSYDNQLYSNVDNAFWTIYTDEDGNYDFYGKAEQLQNDYHTSNDFGKYEFLIEQKTAVMYESYTQKMAGTTLRTIWLRATMQAGFYNASYLDYYDFDDPETGARFNDFSDCVDFDSDFANYTEEERGAKIYVDMNVADNCTYNEDIFYQKDFTERYPHASEDDDPNLGTDRNSYQDTTSDGTPIPDLYVEEEDTIRGLVNQMVSKYYTCVFMDYHYEEGVIVIDRIWTPDYPLQYGGQWILFPTQQNLYQVGFLEDACNYFGEIVPIEPPSTHRIISYNHTYVLDMDNYKDYLLNSEFFQTRLPHLFLTLNEEETQQMIQGLYDEVVKYAEYYETEQEETTTYYHNGVLIGADGSGIGTGSNNTNNSDDLFLYPVMLPVSNFYSTSCYGYRAWDNAFHTGMDFGGSGTWNNADAPIVASWSGTVIFVRDSYPNLPVGVTGTNSSAFNVIEILLDPLEASDGATYDNIIVSYIHVSPNVSVSIGQKVVAGTLLGYVGHNGNSSAYHLHMEVYTCMNGGTNCSYGLDNVYYYKDWMDPAVALGIYSQYCN